MPGTVNPDAFDVLFLHAPSSFNKGRNPLSGVFPAEVGTNDYFLHPPLGMMVLHDRLEAAGFTPGFSNVGRALYTAMEQEKDFDIDDFVAGFKARGIGIDLQWAVHTPGALDLARVVKANHPDSFVFLGGLTATYFHRELLADYPFIDAVVLGEADEAIVDLATALRGPTFHPETVPNLAYRDGDSLAVTPIRIPTSWEGYRFRNLENGQAVAFLSIKGCTFNCPFCGGSRFSYKNFFHRGRPIALSPDALIDQVRDFEDTGVETVFLVGDVRIMGRAYVDRLLAGLQRENVHVHIRQELFFPPSSTYLEKWKKATSNCSFTFSPESADEKVRRRLGKVYTNGRLWDLARSCSDLEIPLTLCFMFAFPDQDTNSIRSTLDFIDEVTDLPWIDFMIEPMLFVDPGSPIFEAPERWGYQIDFRTIRDFKDNLEKPHWVQSLGYHTRWLSREDLIEAILFVAERSSKIRLKRDPGESVLYLATVENVRANQKAIGVIWEKSPCSDDEVRKIVQDTFPPYLLGDNLVKKNRSPRTDSILYDKFPLLNHLLLEVMGVSADRLLKHYRAWSDALEATASDVSSKEFARIQRAPGPLKTNIMHLMARFHVDRAFIDSLIDYEWVNSLSRCVMCDSGSIDSADRIDPGQFAQVRLVLENTVVFKSFRYDFGNPDWQALSKGQSIKPRRTWYLYNLRAGTHCTVSTSLKRLLDLCDGTRSVEEVFTELDPVREGKELVNGMILAMLAANGVLKASS
jgi:radical SAM superfamily enzyme YgiQ (UPF0313 family)